MKRKGRRKEEELHLKLEWTNKFESGGPCFGKFEQTNQGARISSSCSSGTLSCKTPGLYFLWSIKIFYEKRLQRLCAIDVSGLPFFLSDNLVLLVR